MWRLASGLSILPEQGLEAFERDQGVTDFFLPRLVNDRVQRLHFPEHLLFSLGFESPERDFFDYAPHVGILEREPQAAQFVDRQV